MYNEEIKKQFIDYYTNESSTNGVVTRIFNRLEKYEKEWDADFCTKSTDELQSVIDDIAGVRIKSITATISTLHEYVKWCIDTGVPGACDGMLQIKSTGTDKIKKKMVASPLHLKVYLDDVFSPVEEGTIDNTYRCFFWMIYAGVDENDGIGVAFAD